MGESTTGPYLSAAAGGPAAGGERGESGSSGGGAWGGAAGAPCEHAHIHTHSLSGQKSGK